MGEKTIFQVYTLAAKPAESKEKFKSRYAPRTIKIKNCPIYIL
jgi:hypothetical protein